MNKKWLVPCIGALVWHSSVSRSETIVLTLRQAVVRARERAPAVVSARARIGEARASLRDASILLQDNPVVETFGGATSFPREGTFLALGVSIAQKFRLGGQRSARIEVANAGIVLQRLESADTTRRLLRGVAVAFLSALYAKKRTRVLASARDFAREVLRAAERRFQAGAISILDVNLAKASAARAAAELLAAQAARRVSLGKLRSLLGMRGDKGLEVEGHLRPGRRYALASLLAKAEARPDVEALVAALRQAQANWRLGRSLAWPDLGFRLSYQRTEGAHEATAGIFITLPIFQRGQGLRARSRARSRRLRFELEARRRAVEVEVRTAFESYRHQLRAILALERDALPGLERNETLALRSFNAGQIGLTQLLLARRELLQAKQTYLKSLLGGAVAGVELEASAGVLR